MYDSFTPYEIDNIQGSILVPTSVHTQNNITASYFRKYLFEKAISVFKWNLPKTWNKDYFLYILYVLGYIAVIDCPEFGVVPQRCTLSGYDLYYAPRYAMIANPLIKKDNGGRYEINTECELIKLQGNYTGIYDLVCYYASKMALASEAVEMNLINSKLSRIFGCKDKAAAESYKKMTDKVLSGEPAVFIDKNLFADDGTPQWVNYDSNLKQNYIVNDLLIDLRKLENEFCTDLGIPNTNTDKRERLTDDEVNSNNTETAIRSMLWLERLQSCCERVNDRFGEKLDSKLSVEWRVNPNDSNVNINGPSGILSEPV